MDAAAPTNAIQPAVLEGRGGSAAVATGGAVSGTAADEAIADETLMLAYAAGDAASFAQLYARHERPVYRFLLRSVRGQPALADDLLQEVWLAVIRNAATYAPRARFTTWLFTIARSKLIDHWRGADTALSLDAMLASDAANDPDATLADSIAAADTVRPDVQAMSRAAAAAFVAAVEQLPPSQREAFLLHAEGGLSVDEVGVATGVGFETAKSRLRYAMSRLRNAMREWR